MKLSAALSASVVLALVPCEAQVKIELKAGGLIIQGGAAINGGVLTINGEGSDGSEGEAAETGQLLEFADGSRLHGWLEKVDQGKKEIVWRSLETSSPITFSLAQVSRWDAALKVKPVVKACATVKLTGGDWLSGELSEISKDKIQMTIGEGATVAVERARIEWIYLSKTAAVECYDGPTSLSGWVSDGSWTYRDGALRAAGSSVIGRMFTALPDQVEYQFESDLGPRARTFLLMLHSSEPASRNVGPGVVRLMLNAQQLQVWSPREDQLKQEQVDISKILPELAGADAAAPEKRKPLRWRIFEDRVAGRMVVFINGRKVADFRDLGKMKSGANRGAVSFQSMGASGLAEQSVAKIRVQPWDGFVPVDDALEDVRPKTDLIVQTDGERVAGRIESVTADKVQIGKTAVLRENVFLMRFGRPATVPEEDPPVGRVQLAPGGDFEVTALAFQDGKLRVRTHFGGEIVLPVASVRGLEFAHLTPLAGKPVDLLLFKNGDQLRGLLATSEGGPKLRWQTRPTAPPVDLEVARLSGVLLAPRADRPMGKTGVLARCRNGDLLAGDFVALDKEKITLENGVTGRLTIPRDNLQALYFSKEGKLPVVSGAMEHEVWESGVNLGANRRTEPARNVTPKTEAPPSPSRWSYFDGAFALKSGRNTNDGNVGLGRVVEGMPPRVEFSFEVTGKRNQIFFSSQLFSGPGDAGYMVQFHPGGLFIYDNGAEQRERGRGPQQLQVQFGEKVQTVNASRRIRIFTDRVSGRMTVLVDGVEVAKFGPKTGAAPRNLGAGLMLMPQQNQFSSFANLWVAPWNGEIPGTGPAGTAATDSVLLANGDETHGTIGTGTPEKVQMESEVGLLDIPVGRLTMLEFGGRAVESPNGVRLRLTDRSVLTVTGYRIEKETLIAQSATVGEIRLPLSAVQEMVFSRPALPAPAKGGEKSTGVRGAALGGNIIQPIWGLRAIPRPD